MLFDSKNYVPLIYRSSRDFEAILKLLDTLLTTNKYEIDTLINLYVPEDCYEDFLPLLAEHIGYKYNYDDKVSENRIIIANFPKMIRNRGSVTGIKLAAALSLNSIENNFDEIQDLSQLDVFFDYDKGFIIVLYPRENTKVRNLLDWVRPVGMYCAEFSADTANVTSELNVDAYANVISLPYQTDIFSYVQQSEVYDGLVDMTYYSDSIHTWEDISNITWEEAELYTWKDFLYDDVSRAIYITFDANGGEISGSSVIHTYKGFNITTLSSDDCSKGIDNLTGWYNQSNGQIVAPGSNMVVTSDYNFTMQAQWKRLQQHKFILDQSKLDSPYLQLKIRPLFLGVICDILIEYKENEIDSWVIEDKMTLTNSTNPNIYMPYILQNSTGYYRISIGYRSLDYADNNNQTVITVNPNVFTDQLFDYASVIDFSEITEITDFDILANFAEEQIISNNEALSTFIFPPNITVLTMPLYFLYNCTNLKEVVFPSSTNCRFIFELINGAYSDNFLYRAGYNVCSDRIFTFPSNIDFYYADYSSYSNNYVTLFNELGIATDIIISSNIINDSNNDVMQIALSLDNSVDYPINSLTLNSSCDLCSLDSNNKLTNLTISANCSIDNYNDATNNLSNSCTNLNIVTDINGASSKINDYQISNGIVTTIQIGGSVTDYGDFTFCNLPNLTSIAINTNIISRSSFQNNTNLSQIQFNNLSNLQIQGFHHLPALTELVLPNAQNLNTCFYDCENLTLLYLGYVNNIDYETIFVNCANLTELWLNTNNYSVEDNVLYTNNRDVLLWVPWGVNEVTTYTSTTTIGSYSFSGCEAAKLSDYVISETVSSDIINSYNEVTLTSNITSIEPFAFKLTDINTLIVLNPNLDLSNLDLNDMIISEIHGYINSTAHIFAVTNSIPFVSIDVIENNINAVINDYIGQNIYQ